MAKKVRRADGRTYDQLRPLSITYDIFEHADGSVLYVLGKTKILCSIKLQYGVPPFLRGKRTGWLTAEYAMLPAATPIRTIRESSSTKRNGRSVEISRMIGRALRSIVKLDLLGEKTIFVDCDVLHADGGTRTACITGAYFALCKAFECWQNNGIIKGELITKPLAAVSVGVIGNDVLLDIDFLEDCSINGDFNFVMTRSGDVVEIQGISEQHPVPWSQFEAMRSLAVCGIETIFQYNDALNKRPYCESIPLGATLGHAISLKNI